jgi:hypothetical protein
MRWIRRSRGVCSTCPQKASQTLLVRRSASCQMDEHAIAQPRDERAESSLQQAVLVAEIVGDQPGRDIGSAGDLRQRRADEADLRQAVDRDLDELAGPSVPSGRPVGCGAQERPFL